MYVSSRAVLVFLLAMLFANSSPVAFAKRGGHGGKGGRPGGDRPQGGERPQGSEGFQRPPKDGGSERPQGDRPSQGGEGHRPRGPPATGLFSIGADRPTLLGSLVNSRAATIAPVNSMTAIYEGKLNDTSTTPTARRALLHDGTPEDIVLMSSTSSDGVTWSPGTLLTIANLPTDLIVRKPTLSEDGSLLFFVGATGDLRTTPSAIHVASCTSAKDCSYSGVAFEQKGKIMSGCAYAKGKLVVPHAGDMVDSTPVDPIPVEPAPVGPTPIARKLLAKKGRGPEDRKELAGEAWIASCDDKGVCTSDGTLVSIPASSPDAKGRGPSAWRGSMIYNNNQYEFYGSGQGYWPLVSSDGTSWSRVDAAQAVDIPGPDPSCAMSASGLVCAAPMKGDRKPDGDDVVQAQPNDLL
jgi:hypothetical protein